MNTLPEKVTAELIEGHRYRVTVDGHAPAIWPGVSEILDANGLSGKKRKTPTQAMALGTIVHEITAGADRLRMEGKDHLVREYIDRALVATDAEGSSLKFIESHVWNWEQWLDDSKAEVLAVEAVVVNPARRYVGTIDRIIKFKANDTWPAWPRLVDLKTGAAYPAHRLQLAAYHEALKYAGIDTHPYAFHTADRLNPWRPENIPTVDDRDMFLSAVDLYYWRERHGLI